jgi:hypothetical protein
MSAPPSIPSSYLLNSTDITNQYIELMAEITEPEKLFIYADSGTLLIRDSDYNVVVLSGKTRIGFLGNIVGPSASKPLETGEYLYFFYAGFYAGDEPPAPPDLTKKTPQRSVFPYWNIEQDETANRYQTLPTPAQMKKRSLFGIPLRSFLTGETVEDSTLQTYVDQAISELEHTLDIYITPVIFEELHDYQRQLQFWSFGYLKVSHSPILNVRQLQLTFNNSVGNVPLVDIPLEFVHVQPQENTVQLVPAQGVTISGYIMSVYAGLGFHAFNAQAISHWPGAIKIIYEAGFEKDKIPALIASLVENIAAYKFLSSLGPVLFPHNSVSIGIDGTSQSVGTLGPGFLQNRLSELEKQIQQQMDMAKGYYQKRFLVDFL